MTRTSRGGCGGGRPWIPASAGMTTRHAHRAGRARRRTPVDSRFRANDDMTRTSRGGRGGGATPAGKERPCSRTPASTRLRGGLRPRPCCLLIVEAQDARAARQCGRTSRGDHPGGRQDRSVQKSTLGAPPGIRTRHSRTPYRHSRAPSRHSRAPSRRSRRPPVIPVPPSVIPAPLPSFPSPFRHSRGSGNPFRSTNPETRVLPSPCVGVSYVNVDMICDCFHTLRMQTMIQIRNVPQSLHRRLKARAAIEGISMSHYVLRAIERALEHPSRQELLEAIRSQPEVRLDPSPAEVLHEERGSR